VVAFNLMMQPYGTFICCLNGPQAVKEWFTKESEISVRAIGGEFQPGLKLGFTGDGSKAGLVYRSVYTEFFLYDRIQKLQKPLALTLDQKLNSLIKQHSLSKTSYVEVNIRDFNMGAALSWVSKLLFGCADESETDIDLDSPRWKYLRNSKFDSEYVKNLGDHKKISLVKLSNVIIENAFAVQKSP